MSIVFAPCELTRLTGRPLCISTFVGNVAQRVKVAVRKSVAGAPQVIGYELHIFIPKGMS